MTWRAPRLSERHAHVQVLLFTEFKRDLFCCSFYSQGGCRVSELPYKIEISRGHKVWKSNLFVFIFFSCSFYSQGGCRVWGTHYKVTNSGGSLWDPPGMSLGPHLSWDPSWEVSGAPLGPPGSPPGTPLGPQYSIIPVFHIPYPFRFFPVPFSPFLRHRKTPNPLVL